MINNVECKCLSICQAQYNDMYGDLYAYKELLKDLFACNEDIYFEILQGGTVSPVHIYRVVDTKKISLGVFKEVKDITFTQKQMQILVEMRKLGFGQAARILESKNGESVITLGKHSYYGMEYLGGDQSDSLISFEEMVQLTAEFHLYAKRCAIPNDFQRNKLEECRRCVTYLTDPELKKWEPMLFKIKEWDIIVNLGKYFASSSFEALYRLLPTQIIHGDIHRENLIVSQGRPPCFIDFDTVKKDVRLLDFAIFSGWHCIDTYMKLLQKGQLFSCIVTYYGELESIEKEYFHTIVLYVWINLLAWALGMLKEYIANKDQDHIEEYRDFIMNATKDVQKLLQYSPNLYYD